MILLSYYLLNLLIIHLHTLSSIHTTTSQDDADETSSDEERTVREGDERERGGRRLEVELDNGRRAVRRGMKT